MLPSQDELTPTIFALMLREQLVASLAVYRDLDILINELKGDPMGSMAPKSVYQELQKSGREIGLSLLESRAMIDLLELEGFWQDGDDHPNPVLNLLDHLARNITLLLTLDSFDRVLDLPWESWQTLQKTFADANVQIWMRKKRPS